MALITDTPPLSPPPNNKPLSATDPVPVGDLGLEDVVAGHLGPVLGAEVDEEAVDVERGADVALGVVVQEVDDALPVGAAHLRHKRVGGWLVGRWVSFLGGYVGGWVSLLGG